ncbi:MAG TPA: hypothetical protein ENG16_01510 [Archaeoglobus sp.]|nr:hypothetical protein [Archaeoglobus sp.]
MEKQVLSASGIDATKPKGTKTRLGYIMIHRYGGSIEVVEVIARQSGAADAYWNIELAGNNIFSTSQSVAAADKDQIFYPDQNKYAAASALPVDFVMKASSATAGSTIDVAVLVKRI